MKQNADYQIFVASSLKLDEQRAAVEKATGDYNREYPDTFGYFEYERSEIDQTVDKEDAQRKINAALFKSPIFFLIIEHNIKELTCFEFQLALERFRSNEMPRFIYIFRQKGIAENPSEDGALTYEEFKEKFNLDTCRIDINGDLVPHSKVYDIPFTDTDDLKAKILEQLNRLPGKLPPVCGKRGFQLKKEDFYTDILRKEGFPKNDAFFRRDFDENLKFDKIKDYKMVLVTGRSLSGKTRSVMEALKEVGDGWVYPIGDRNDCLVEELEMLRRYMDLNDHVKLYIEIDNLDQHVAKADVREALYKLINVVMDEGCAGMIVATASNFTAVNDHLPLKNYGSRFTCIGIPQLSETEFRNAVTWLRLCGVDNIVLENIGYKQLGALFVDLTKVRSRYGDFLSQSDTKERKAILKAIKAQSIWRSDAFGDKKLLRSMTDYFAGGRVGMSVYESAVNSLCEGGLMGVAMGETRLNIEEYVYQYIIGYDGNLKKEYYEIADNSGCIVEKEYSKEDIIEYEKELIIDILNYCINQRQENPKGLVGSESLTRQVSRIVRRCDYQNELGRWLYNMWIGLGNDEFSQILRDDRIACEQEQDVENAHHYSSIVRKYLITTSGDVSECDMKERIIAYERVPQKLRVDELFGALMRTARTTEERQQLLNHPDYKCFENKPDTVLAEMEWAEDYETGRALINKMKSPCDGVGNVELALRMLDTENKPYDLFLYGRIIRRLAILTSDSSEFDDLCCLLRDNIMCLISDQKLLENIRDGKVIIDKESLTIIDLMGALGLWVASQCALGSYGDDLQSCEALEGKLLKSVGETMKGGLTNELQTRMVVSAMCSRLINNIANMTDYDDVYDVLFVPLSIKHPYHNDRSMIFRNTYTYTAMMRCRNVDVRRIMNMFSNDLIPHLRDKYNPFSVNRFTVNTMLNMCKGEGRIYLEQVDCLYDMLGMKRDLFAYNKLIEFAPNLKKVGEILDTMKKESVVPNLFTYLSIQRNDDVDFNTALWLLYDDAHPIKECRPKPSGDVAEMLPDKETLDRIRREVFKYSSIELDSVKEHLRIKDGYAVKELTVPQMLQFITPSWLNLFEKRITSDEDRSNVRLCLKHLQERTPEILIDGKIYNVLLKNGSYIEDFRETIKYITCELEPFGFVSDTYTAGSLLNKVQSLRGADRREALVLLNEFIMTHPKCLNNAIISQRIKLFRNQADSLEFVFITKDGSADKRNYSPIGYLTRMVELGIPIDSFAIYNFMKIKSGLNQSICNALAKLLHRQEYIPEAKDIRTVRELLSPYCDNLPAVYGRLTPMTHNKNIAWNLKKYLDTLKSEKVDFYTVKEMVTESLEALDWNDSNSALCSLNDILDKYVSRMRDLMNGGIWVIIKGYYEKYVKENKKCAGPTSFTLNLLAKSLTTQNEEGRRWFLKELKEHAGQVNLQPHMFGELARTAVSVNELIKLTQSVVNLGCKPNEKTADTYVYYLTTNLLNKDPQNANPILTDLLKYILDSECKNRNVHLLEEGGRTDLFLGYYKDARNISEDLLHSLLVYNYKTNQYDSSFLANRILSICSDSTIAALMNSLVNGNNKRLAIEYIPLFFNKQRDYSNGVILFLTSPEMLPQLDIDKYNRLLTKFYTYKCSLPEYAIPNLLICLSGYKGDGEIVARIRNIYINITLGRLRQGDMLIQKAPTEYASWCHRSLDCIDIREHLKHRIYMTLANLYIQTGSANFKQENTPLYALQRAEKIFSVCVSNGDVALNDLFKLPDLWYKLWEVPSCRWKPSQQLLLSIIRYYSDNPVQYYANISAIAKSYFNAVKLKEAQTRIRYNSLGSFPSENSFYINVDTKKLKDAMPHPFIVNLCNRVVDSNNNDIYKKRTVDHEYDFVRQFINGNISVNIIDNIPPLIALSRWNISEKLSNILADQLAKKGYINLMNYTHNNKIETVYIKKALWKSEKQFAISLRDIQFPTYETFTLINSLLVLWNNLYADIHWLPRRELVLAIVSILAKIPNIAHKQIALIASDIFKADRIHYSYTCVLFNSLGNYHEDSSLFIKIPTKDLMAVMPHQYIVSLCKRTLRQSQSKVVVDDPCQTKRYEYEYLEFVKNNKMNEQQINSLRTLWRKTNWHPQPALQSFLL